MSIVKLTTRDGKPVLVNLGNVFSMKPVRRDETAPEWAPSDFTVINSINGDALHVLEAPEQITGVLLPMTFAELSLLHEAAATQQIERAARVLAADVEPVKALHVEYATGPAALGSLMPSGELVTNVNDAFKAGEQWAEFKLAQLIHFPDHWDTAAYPTLRDALKETLSSFQCSECGEGMKS